MRISCNFGVKSWIFCEKETDNSTGNNDKCGKELEKLQEVTIFDKK